MKTTKKVEQATIKRKVTVSFKTPIQANTLTKKLKSQLEGNKDFESGKIVIERNDEEGYLAVICYSTCSRIPELTI